MDLSYVLLKLMRDLEGWEEGVFLTPSLPILTTLPFPLCWCHSVLAQGNGTWSPPRIPGGKQNACLSLLQFPNPAGCLHYALPLLTHTRLCLWGVVEGCRKQASVQIETPHHTKLTSQALLCPVAHSSTHPLSAQKGPSLFIFSPFSWYYNLFLIFCGGYFKHFFSIGV